MSTVPLVLDDGEHADALLKAKSEAMRTAQRIITTATEERAARLLPETDADHARLLALRQPGASTWMVHTNTNHLYRLSDSDVQHQLRLNLGMPPTNNDERCMCGAPLTHGHAQTCLRLRKKCTETRHDTVVRAFARCATDAALTVHVEARPLHRHNEPIPHRLRPDLLIEGPDVNVLADVVITTPTAPTYLNAGSARAPLRAAHINAQRKVQKYAELAKHERRDLYPVAIESYGGMAEKARALINLIADRAAEAGGAGQYQRTETLSHVRAVVAAALVRGNARLVETVIRHAQRPRSRAIVRAANGGIMVALRA